MRWHALFSSPFFHPSVLVDRGLLDRHELRYDPEYLESEDYDLWTRLLAVADGHNLAEPLVLYRSHPGQASKRRRALQRNFQRRVALREIARVAPDLPAEAAELAWQVGVGEEVGPGRLEDAADAFCALDTTAIGETTRAALLENTFAVDLLCGLNRHTVRLESSGAADRLDFTLLLVLLMADFATRGVVPPAG